MHSGLRDLLACLAALCLPVLCSATVPAPAGFDLRKQWIETNLKPARERVAERSDLNAQRKAGLYVLANNGGVLMNGRPDGRPIKIGDREFKRGMICHAKSEIVVRLPGPGKAFSAIAGVDANAGGGSVVFSVAVGQAASFTSNVMRGSEPGVPVSVDLGGAREFTISASEAGDGISFDHADWAEAKVTLVNGKELWLSDMAVIGVEPPKRLAPTPPFSFVCNGKSSDVLLPTWDFSESTEKLDEFRTQRTQVYTEPKTRLQVRVVSVTYSDFPTMEWIVYIKNAGDADSPIIENIQGLDTALTRSKKAGEFRLHHSRGSTTSPQDYEPLVDELAPGTTTKITGVGGVPTSVDLSYFNIELAKDRGVVLALGWSGQWASSFIRDAKRGLRVISGQELTHLKLHPGEEIRTPQIVMQFWKGGDWIDAQNTWRRWMVAHNMPRPNGKTIAPQYGGCNGNLFPLASEEIAQINAYLADGVKMDHWIIDAGWYPCSTETNGWWWTGTWEPDKARFPKGLREVADHVHANGMDFIVWFEPERVGSADSWLAKNHPEWLLNGQLMDLGRPEVRNWVIEMVDGMMKSQGIDHYRTDFNFNPLECWRGADAPDRQGMTENLYVQGFRWFWDELLRRDPKRYIDTCSGGGRRNDVETLRRSVPLLRSDFWAPTIDWAIGMQGQAYGIALWMPYSGTGAACCDIYTMRSAYCPAYRIGYNGLDPNRKKDLMLQAVREINLLKPYWLSDYYPLTPYNRSKSEWIAMQFDAPEKGGGFVQAFRREECADGSKTFKLRGLDTKADYRLINFDEATPKVVSGKLLTEEGLKIDVPGKPGAAVVMYEKVK